jgi:thioester reductase-like protein
MEPWTPENGKLTYSIKPCRPFLERHFADQITALYSQIHTRKQQQLKRQQELKAKFGQAIQGVLQTIPTSDEAFDQDFVSLGGDSFSAIQLVNKLKDEENVQVPVDLLFNGKHTLAEIAEFVSKVETETPKSNEEEDIDLEEEIRSFGELEFLESGLYTDWIHKKHTMLPPPPGSSEIHFFLTGATGFVGSFLLYELLKQYPGCLVYCLVRATSESQGYQRIHETMRNYLLWNEDEDYHSRVIPVIGDLSLERFGLTKPEFFQLASKISSVIHCGASVNSILPYSALKKPNVLGTVEALKLACFMKKKPFIFISTISIYNCLKPAQVFEECVDLARQFSPLRAKKASGYSQSKYVAECLVFKAGETLPTMIVRPALVSSSTQTGAANLSDWFNLLLAGIVSVGAYVEPISNLPLNLVPVDYIVQIILKLGQNSRADNIFNIVHPHRNLSLPEYALLDIMNQEEDSNLENLYKQDSNEQQQEQEEPTSLTFTQILQILLEAYPKLKNISMMEWYQQAKHKITKEHPFYPMIDDFKYSSELVPQNSHECFAYSNTKRLAGNINIKIPSITRETIQKNINYLIQIHFLPSPHQN